MGKGRGLIVKETGGETWDTSEWSPARKLSVPPCAVSVAFR